MALFGNFLGEITILTPKKSGPPKILAFKTVTKTVNTYFVCDFTAILLSL